jgi:hypothetical protein
VRAIEQQVAARYIRREDALSRKILSRARTFFSGACVGCDGLRCIIIHQQHVEIEIVPANLEFSGLVVDLPRLMISQYRAVEKGVKWRWVTLQGLEHRFLKLTLCGNPTSGSWSIIEMHMPAGRHIRIVSFDRERLVIFHFSVKSALLLYNSAV